MNLTSKQAIDIYDELIHCMNNNNGYGGDTAEIYAYRLWIYSPLLARGRETIIFQKEHDKIYIDGAKSLCDVIEYFIEKNGSRVKSVLIDELNYKTWLKRIKNNFQHRSHVKVILKHKK